MRRLILLSLAALALVATGCGTDDTTSASGDDAAPAAAETTAPAETTEQAEVTKDPRMAKKPQIEQPTGKAPKTLKKKDLIVGTGATAQAGNTVSVQYVGVLYENAKQFDASWDRNEPFEFGLGQGQVIPGWDEGVAGMKVGGRRQLTIPPDLAYGAQRAGADIPPNATLIFVVDLEEIL